MSSTRTRHVVGGGLGTIRQRDRARWEMRKQFEDTQRNFTHRAAVDRMHAAAQRAH